MRLGRAKAGVTMGAVQLFEFRGYYPRIAELTGFNQHSIAAWGRGVLCPRVHQKRVLERKLGIFVSSWSEPALEDVALKHLAESTGPVKPSPALSLEEMLRLRLR